MRRIRPNKKVADELYSQIIRSRGKCERCKSTYKLQTAHIVSRRYYQTRWDTDNAFAFCFACHHYFTFRPIEWEEYLKATIGETKLANLKKRALNYQKIDYKEIIERLENELRKLA